MAYTRTILSRWLNPIITKPSLIISNEIAGIVPP